MESSDMRVPRQAATLRLLVEERLRAAISSGLFKPGQRLVERELCELMGVGRTSVREGLRQLEAEQLVTTIPHRGPIVAIISVEAAEQLYAARGLIEGYAGRIFAQHAPEEEIAALGEAVQELAEAVEAGESAALINAKTTFYSVLMKGCRNQFLEQMLTQLNNRINLLRVTSMNEPGRIERSLRELRAIHGAIATRDADAAEAACRYHIEQAAKIALAVLSRQESKLPVTT